MTEILDDVKRDQMVIDQMANILKQLAKCEDDHLAAELISATTDLAVQLSPKAREELKIWLIEEHKNLTRVKNVEAQ